MKKTIRLENIVKELLNLSDFTQGIKQEISLTRGLRIGIRTLKDCREIEISREGVQPSMAEWYIVINKAGFKEKITPRIMKENGRTYIRGSYKK